MAKTADALIKVAEGEIGYDRYKDPEQGTKYGRWYAKLTNSPWFGTNGVPFCAMFASWCLAQLGIQCVGTPTASCTSGLLTSARNANALLPASQGKKGDLVLFSWSKGGYYAAEADHVGILKANHSNWMDTIEGNVDDGKVLARERNHVYVVGCIRPKFETPKAGPFTDVDESTPHYADIKWMKDMGIAKGYADGTYRPDSALTRADAAAFLHRLYEAVK